MNSKHIFCRGIESSTRFRGTTIARPRPIAAGSGRASKVKHVQESARLEMHLERETPKGGPQLGVCQRRSKPRCESSARLEMHLERETPKGGSQLGMRQRRHKPRCESNPSAVLVQRQHVVYVCFTPTINTIAEIMFVIYMCFVSYLLIYNDRHWIFYRVAFSCFLQVSTVAVPAFVRYPLVRCN